jgi:hypothetical protein
MIPLSHFSKHIQVKPPLVLLTICRRFTFALILIHFSCAIFFIPNITNALMILAIYSLLFFDTVFPQFSYKYLYIGIYSVVSIIILLFFISHFNLYAIVFHIVFLLYLSYHRKFYTKTLQWSQVGSMNYDEAKSKLRYDINQDSKISRYNDGIGRSEHILSISVSFLIQHSFNMFIPGLGFFIHPFFDDIFPRLPKHKFQLSITEAKTIMCLENYKKGIMISPFILALFLILLYFLTPMEITMASLGYLIHMKN